MTQNGANLDIKNEKNETGVATVTSPISISAGPPWNMLGTVLRRRERHLYVAIWFYLATFITVALLNVVNSFELPVSLLKSYSMYAGVQDALAVLHAPRLQHVAAIVHQQVRHHALVGQQV